MRVSTTIAVAVALTALSACNRSESPAEPAATEAATEAAAAATWTPALPAAGTYEVSDSAGKALAKVTVNADMSYLRVPTTGPNEAGIVKLIDGKVCFDPSGTKLPNDCYIESVRAADGSFTATDDKGVVVTAKPAAS
jgi:hypothetical protein